MATTWTFTNAKGTTYLVEHYGYKTAPDGTLYTAGLVTVTNPKIGHGWTGEVRGEVIEAWELAAAPTTTSGRALATVAAIGALAAIFLPVEWAGLATLVTTLGGLKGWL